MKKILAISGMLLLLCLTVHAQELESFAGLRFHFDDPGARAQGMGGAAAALQDGANALVNPAAIAGAGRGTISIEARDLASNAQFLTPTLDSFEPVTTRSSSRGVRNIAVTIQHGATAFAFFADEPLHAAASTTSIAANHPFSRGVALVGNGRIVDPSACARVACHGEELDGPLPWMASMRNRRYGAAAAWKRGALSAGASLRYETLTRTSALLDGSRSTPYLSITTETDDHAVTYGAGVQWQPASILRLGAAYASGARFDGTRTVVDFDNGPRSVATSIARPATLRAGVAIEASPSVTLTADAVRVGYRTTRGEAARSAGAFMPDVTELHAGAEVRSHGVALRAGWWRDPAHELRSPRSLPFPFDNILLLERADENHLTLGAGFGSERLRVDAAHDRGRRSRQTTIAVASTF